MNHYEIIKQILRHLCQYNKNFLSIDRYTHGKGRKFGLGENISSYIYGADSIIYIHTTENGESKSIEKEITNLSKKYWKFTDDYKFVITNITLSLLSLNNIDNLKADMENQVISQKIGDSEIVLALELSLQYLHKIILSII